MPKRMENNMKKEPFLPKLKKDLRRNRGAYLMFLPVLVYYLIFCYKPMYGVIIAFKNFNPTRGILASPWAANHGLVHFISFFKSVYFGRLIRNTLVISITSLFVTFPLPIVFALLLNEVRSRHFKGVVQTCSYLPHFISTVVVCSMVTLFVNEKGFITNLLVQLGIAEEGFSLLTNKDFFVPIYVLSGLWQTLGWSAIIYVAALSGVDQELYDAARIDGANRLQQTIHVTIPAITMTIIMMFILRLGSVMSVGSEKILLLYNEAIYETADVISTYVFRKGLVDSSWSYSAAIGLFNSTINLILVVSANRISRKLAGMSLW